MKYLLLICLLSLNTVSFAWAHGEDQPGPNGGHIRMPGHFHTEMMLDDEQGAHIFLLDTKFENPTVKDSKIEMKFVGEKKEVPFTCSVMGGNHFHCIPKSKYPANGELRIRATREKIQGQEEIYKLPLETFKEATEKTHQGH